MLTVERLSSHHDRRHFDCGVEELNSYLQKYSSQHERKGIGRTYVATGFARKVGSLAVLVSLRISVYLCVLCVKYIGANDLTQSTQRYAEFAEKTRIAT